MVDSGFDCVFAFVVHVSKLIFHVIMYNLILYYTCIISFFRLTATKNVTSVIKDSARISMKLD